MAVFTKGNFNLNLGFVSLGGEMDEQDRQCAWELYCELVSRVGVSGKVDDQERLDFSGEIHAESLESLYRFFGEARSIMKKYPVGRITLSPPHDHLGVFIASMLEVIIRPFLEKWQARYRYWWAHESDQSLPPFQRQARFPLVQEMLADWTAVRRFCRDATKELAQTYKLKDVTDVMPARLRMQWIHETKMVTKDV